MEAYWCRRISLLEKSGDTWEVWMCMYIHGEAMRLSNCWFHHSISLSISYKECVHTNKKVQLAFFDRPWPLFFSVSAGPLAISRRCCSIHSNRTSCRFIFPLIHDIELSQPINFPLSSIFSVGSLSSSNWVCADRTSSWTIFDQDRSLDGLSKIIQSSGGVSFFCRLHFFFS